MIKRYMIVDPHGGPADVCEYGHGKWVEFEDHKVEMRKAFEAGRKHEQGVQLEENVRKFAADYGRSKY